MPGENTLDCCEAYAGTGKVSPGMKSLKWPEELVLESWVESSPIIANEIGGIVGRRIAAVACLHAEFNAALFMLRGIFPRVANQIVENNAHESSVGYDFRDLRDDEPDLARGV